MKKEEKTMVITCPIPADPTPRFLAALPDVDIIVSDDSDGNLSAFAGCDKVRILDFAAQRQLLGERLYRKFEPYHKSSACRNIAHYLAYKEGYERVVSLDYDCVVPEGYLKTHTAALGMRKVAIRKSSTGWVNPLESTQWYSRGFPYAKRVPDAKISESSTVKRVVLNMGIWENVVDINGIDKMVATPPRKFATKRKHTVVDGFIPLCGMNNMFLRDIIPAYFFLPNVRLGDWTLSRHDDIWGGYLLQLLVRKRGDAISYGEPTVYHERESNRSYVLHFEHHMHLLENTFYSLADAAAARVRKGSYQSMFADLAEEFGVEVSRSKITLPKHYFTALEQIADSLVLWRTFFQKL